MQLYFDRIARYNAPINAVAYLSRTALDEADLLDRERALGPVRGPLHGIPIAVKDIINTTNMPTTGGAVAFAGIVPPYDAPLVANLKRAGAIIIAKTTLTELANWVTVGMPANYSGLFGYSMNPYDPRPDPRDRHQRRPAGHGHRRLELGHRHGVELLGRQRRH